MYQYKAQVKAVIDADTIDVLIDLGFGVHTMQRLRLYGIDAPEMKTEAGKIAKEYVKSVLLGADASMFVYVRTLKDKKDKYGRKLAVLYFDPASMLLDHDESKIEMMASSFNLQIVRNGHAAERYW
jgi:endonuclease YncB( thermonuclease family)